MSDQKNMQTDVLILNMEHQLEELAAEMFGKGLEELEDKQMYDCLLEFTKRLMEVS